MQINLPPQIPAACVVQSAQDYGIPEMLLISIIKVESAGNSKAVNVNKDGSLDIGITQLNSRSWVPYMQERYNIPPKALLANPCQAIRASAYVIKREAMTQQCAGDWWCAAGRYHSPNNRSLQLSYKQRLYAAWRSIVQRGEF